ncbi:MAG: hypothetical protein OEX00_09955, partial [Gammaproteobacteria bacterium]|nr:hypothetical protein [Gammaproteobacteria bacterium]
MKENNVTLLLSKGLLSLLLLAIGGATQAADVAISGVVEVEGAYVEDYAKQKTTGIGLATVEIALQS